MSAQDLALFLHKKMGEQRVNNTEMVRRTGISRRTWYRLLNADIEEARLSTLIKLANALDISITRLMDIYFGHQHSSTKKTKPPSHKTNLPSNSLIGTGQTFTKTWALKNTSRFAWRGLMLKCIDDLLDIKIVEKTTGKTIPIPILIPESDQIAIPDTPIGEIVTITAAFLAPNTPCTTVSHWRFYQDDTMLQGNAFPALDCLVKIDHPETIVS